jgi:hypothetical protein
MYDANMCIKQYFLKEQNRFVNIFLNIRNWNNIQAYQCQVIQKYGMHNAHQNVCYACLPWIEKHKTHAENEANTHRKKTKTMCYLVRLLVECKKNVGKI